MLAQDGANVINTLGIVYKDCCVAFMESGRGKLDQD